MDGRAHFVAEQTALPAGAALRFALGGGDDLVQGGEHRASGGQGIEGAGFDDAFQGAAVQPRAPGAAAEVVYRFIGAVLLAFLDQRADGAFAYAFHCGQPYPQPFAFSIAIQGE